MTDPLGDHTDMITAFENCAESRHRETGEFPRLTTVSVPMKPDPQEFETENEAANVPDGGDDDGCVLRLGLSEAVLLGDDVVVPPDA
ncbi:hypothetical protein [Actinomadura gamaensis]|uniref:Uncharacterized protein n=1 Tax=Actinomadura gamaensis TaxID=1763541 RepID=A0ABV9TYA4_9ACTN